MLRRAAFVSTIVLGLVLLASATTHAAGPADAREAHREALIAGADPIDWLLELDRPVSPGRRFFVFPRPHAQEVVTGNTLTIDVPPAYTVLEGLSPQPVDDMPSSPPFPGTPGVGWSLRAPCNQDPAQITFDFAGTGQGGAVTSSQIYTVQPAITPLAANQDLLSRWAEQTFSFPIAGSGWTLVRLDTGVGPVDLTLDDDLCIDSPYATSAEPGRDPDLVAIFGPSTGSGTHYALIEPTDDSVASRHEFVIQHRASSELPLGVPIEETVSGFFALRGWHFPTVAGRLYTVSAASDSPLDPFRLAGFVAGSTPQPLADAAFARDEASAHQVAFLAEVTGSFVVTLIGGGGSTGFGTADVTLLVREDEPLFADGFEAGSTAAWSQTVP